MVLYFTLDMNESSSNYSNSTAVCTINMTRHRIQNKRRTVAVYSKVRVLVRRGRTGGLGLSGAGTDEWGQGQTTGDRDRRVGTGTDEWGLITKPDLQPSVKDPPTDAVDFCVHHHIKKRPDIKIHIGSHDNRVAPPPSAPPLVWSSEPKKSRNSVAVL
ncbi:hypothetical protein INR49_010317 [Caranx melampygus]|nr:hypothetical protein INR49_010317 [Caranx melampygus]